MGPFTQLEASHEMISEGLIATVEKVTNTVESEEDTPLFRQRLQRVLGVGFIDAATKKDRKSASIDQFRQKEGLGSYQRFLRTVLAQYSEQAICPRGLSTHRRENFRSDPTEAEIVRQSSLDTSVISSYVEPESQCLVPTYTSANGTKLQTLHRFKTHHWKETFISNGTSSRA